MTNFSISKLEVSGPLLERFLEDFEIIGIGSHPSGAVAMNSIAIRIHLDVG